MSEIKKWYDIGGAESDIAVSSRIRLARNIARFPFPGRMTPEHQREVFSYVSEALTESAGGMEFSSIQLKNRGDGTTLVEKHLISPELSSAAGIRGVVLSRDESTSVMINEEDHLRIQVIKTGFDLDGCMQTAEGIDKLLEERFDFAFDERLGYLTHCPTNLGTGLRASVMLHLPALTASGEIRQLIPAVSKLGFAVRGMYGEGSSATGAMYQISNQLTLGISEADSISRLSDIVSGLIIGERDTRLKQSADNPNRVLDKVWRAVGVLSTAYLLTSEEAEKYLSDLRLGVSEKLISGISIESINSLQNQIRPASISEIMGGSPTSEQRDAKRAELCKNMVSPALFCT